VATLLSLPRSVYPAQTRSIPIQVVPVGVGVVKCTINRFDWPVRTKIVTAKIELSFDSGSTWPQAYEVWLDGSKISHKGNPDAPSGFSFEMREPLNAGRRVRGALVIAAAVDASLLIEAI
jgi:hypothetical protein